MSDETEIVRGADSASEPAGDGSGEPCGEASAPPIPRAPLATFSAALASPRYAIPLLVILGALLYLGNLGGYPLYTKGEPREAVTVYDIVHGGGIILPMRAGVEIPSKPLLMHWIGALFSIIGGVVTAFTVRLPSALFAIGGILACYGYIRRLYDSATGLIAALILATAAEYLQAGTGSRVDMTLTFFLEIAFFEFILIAEGMVERRMLMYLAIALAVLAKGPVGLALPAIAGFIFIVVERRWDLLRRLHLIRGAIVVLIIGGGWYGAAIYEGGMSFVKKQLIAENLVRFVGGPAFHEGHAHLFIYVEFALLAGFMPWTLLLPIPAILAIKRPRRLDSRLLYLLIWFVAVLVFYDFAKSKRGVYLLALYPALAAILALYLRDEATHWRRGSPPKTGARAYTAVISTCGGIALLVTGAGALVSLAMLELRPAEMAEFAAFWGVSAPGFIPALKSAVAERWLWAAGLPIAVELLGYLILLRPSSIIRLVGVMAASAACIALAANLIVVPAIANTLSLRGFTMQMINTVGSRQVAYLDALNYDIAFYSGMDIPIVRASDPNLPDYLIAWAEIYNSMPPVRRSQYTVAIQSNPTSLDGTGVIFLLRRRSVTPPSGAGTIEARAKSDLRFYEARDLRSREIAAESRGRISAEVPRRLGSQIGVNSDS